LKLWHEPASIWCDSGREIGRDVEDGSNPALAGVTSEFRC